MTDNRTVFAVAPLPPPVGGFSVINQHMVDQLMRRTTVVVLDRAPAVSWRPVVLGTALRACGLFARFVAQAARSRPRALYLALSGGIGRWLDLPFAAVARLLGIDTYVHHHSFAYLRQPNLADRVIMWGLSKAVHVVLCHRMAQQLQTLYAIPAERIRVLSNAAFLPDCEAEVGNAHSGPLVIGYFSAITRAKGAHRFIEAMSALTRAGIDVVGRMAGPLEAGAASEFHAAVASVPEVTYLGPVYGPRKSEFLSGLDLLLFPSDYKNEAEPVAICEAQQHGAQVLCTDIGCCGSLVTRPALGATLALERYAESVVDYVTRGLRDGTLRTPILTHGLFEHKRTAEQAALQSLLSEVCAAR